MNVYADRTPNLCNAQEVSPSCLCWWSATSLSFATATVAPQPVKGKLTCHLGHEHKRNAEKAMLGTFSCVRIKLKHHQTVHRSQNVVYVKAF